MKILGPARKLLRVRQQEARIKRVQAGAGETVHVTLEPTEDGRRIELQFDRNAWGELRERVDRAFVFER